MGRPMPPVPQPRRLILRCPVAAPGSPVTHFDATTLKHMGFKTFSRHQPADAPNLSLESYPNNMTLTIATIQVMSVSDDVPQSHMAFKLGGRPFQFAEADFWSSASTENGSWIADFYWMSFPPVGGKFTEPLAQQWWNDFMRPFWGLKFKWSEQTVKLTIYPCLSTCFHHRWPDLFWDHKLSGCHRACW